MKQQMERQSGQSVILIAFAMIALLALMALVVDAGNAYVQRRQMDNAVDAASQAGSIAWAQKMSNGAVYDTVTKYFSRNLDDPSNAQAQVYYVGQDANGNTYPDTNNPVASLARQDTAPMTVTVKINNQWVNLPVVGVSVQGTKKFNTYFAGVVGWRQMDVGGGTTSFAMCGVSNSDNLFPIAIASTSFKTGIYFQQTNPSWTYQLNENLTNQNLNYAYVTWNTDTTPATLRNRMGDLDSGIRSAGDSVLGVTDSMYSDSSLYNILAGMDSANTQVTVPIYDTYNSQTHMYHIQGFARIQITGTHKGMNGFWGDYGYLQVQLLLWTDPTGDGGGANYGDCAVKTHQDTNPQRVLTGSVSLQKISLKYTHPVTEHIPVDVVNVLDVSGSMTGNFGSQSKLDAAKSALTNFNNNLLPAQGDLAALVTFPKMQNCDNNGHCNGYNYVCPNYGYWNQYYYANKVDGLTSNIATVNNDISHLTANGGTPLAGGLQVGLQTVLGAGHQTSHVAVMIVASDGIANVFLNTNASGFIGDTYNPPSNGCNNLAEQDALAQANIAKGDTNPQDGNPDVIVFSIALGDSFNPALLQSIATPDTSINGQPAKPHYFRVTDASSMASIYQQISERVNQIGSESCSPSTTTAFAGGATITLKNLRTYEQRTLNTTSTGEFIWPNADYGTYQVMSSSVTIDGYTYNVFTDGVGGQDLMSNPTVDVLQEDGTYKTDVFLRNSTPLTCN